jgi:hypothetical protein
MTVMATTGLLVGVAACTTPSPTEPEADGPGAQETDAEPDAGTVVTEPAATSPGAVRPYLDELLQRYDRVASQILADPAVVRDRDAPLVEDLVSLFEPGSDSVDVLLDAWEEMADEGTTVGPFSESLPPSVTTIDGELVVLSADEVSFATCDELRYLVYDDSGAVVQRTAYLAQPGTALAVRTDGEWHLRELAAQADHAGCRNEET